MINMSFRAWMEIFDQPMAQQVQGQWEPSLSEDSSSYIFRFNLASDPEKSCAYMDKQIPCYYVQATQAETGNGWPYVAFSFGHVTTGTNDRSKINRDIEQQTTVNPSREMFNSVISILNDFVTQKKPEIITWTPVKKSEEGAINPEARDKVYNLWARKFLAKDYVQSSNSWVRKDISQAVQSGQQQTQNRLAQYQQQAQQAAQQSQQGQQQQAQPQQGQQPNRPRYRWPRAS